MRLINCFLQMSRLLVAMTLVVGPSSPAFAGFNMTPASSNKDAAAIQLTGAASAQGAQARVAPGSLKIPMYFEANKGQTDASVKFFTRAGGYNLYLTASEAVTVLRRAEADKTKAPLVLRMRLKGANPNPSVEGQGVLPGRTSYFLGNDSSKWQTGVKQYSRVNFAQVYPGIDMVYRFDKGNVEYDFIVAPGANPGRILMGFKGAEGMRLDPKGNLVLNVEGGELTYNAPKLYQTLGTKRVSVKGRFVLASNNNVRFEVGNYIKSKELVIDPEIHYSTYLGGVDDDAINGMAIDSLGAVYVTGWSISAMSGETPATAGFPPALENDPTPATIGAGVGRQVFVAKLSADGAALLWLAWMGGVLADEAKAIALEKTTGSAPKIYIAGVTNSPTFPVAGPSIQVCSNITGDGITSKAFVAELSQLGAPAAPALIYSTCLGGITAPGITSGNAIAVDGTGAAYVTGTTSAADFAISAGIPFPYNSFAASTEDAFVVKIPEGAVGGAVSYSMLLGPQDAKFTNANAIAVDSLGNAWVAGRTSSSLWPAATGAGTGVFDHHFASAKIGTAPGFDAFVVKVNTTGTGLDYATYINGDNNESAVAIALNNGGAWPYHVFVTGDTDSDTDFPSTAYVGLPVGTGAGERPVVWDKTIAANNHPFVLRLNPDETPVVDPANPLEMVYATHLGSPGTSVDYVLALALDSRDDAYIAGYTLASDWVTDPTGDYLADCTIAAPINPVGTVGGSARSNTSGGQDGFVVAVGPTGLTVPFYTYLGATPGTAARQAASAIAIDANHNIFVAGYTPSAAFPLTTGSLMDGSGGLKSINRDGTAGKMDGFIMKINPVLSFGAPLVSAVACSITSITPSSGYTVGGDTVTIVGTDLYGFTNSSVTFDTVGVSSFTMYASSTSLTAVVPRHPLVGALAAGPVTFRLTNSTGTCSASYTYIAVVPTCTISGISPLSGDSAGGTSVDITGTSFFGVVMSSNVAFGADEATSYTVNLASTVITAVSPRHPLVGALTAGSEFITVVTSSGTCTVAYNYVLAVPACGEDFFYPSPATGASGTFAYCMALPGIATIKVYNVMGDLVAKLEDSKAAGAQTSVLNTARLAPGVYLYRLEKDYGGSNSTTSKVKKFAVRH